MSENDQILKSTPLYRKHVALGARMVPFAGWNMPVQYTGIIEEHMHTRTRAGLFDICHMGEFIVKGSASARDLETLLTCRVDDMPVGRCRYGFMLNEKAGIIDDLIVFKTGPYEYMLVVNAGTIDKDRSWVLKHLSPTTGFSDESPNLAKLDLQGPLSGKVLAAVIGEDAVRDIKRYYFAFHQINGVKTLVSRTGYTGELGYELYFPVEYAEVFWDMLIKVEDVKPIGLGARDTLRLEMGYSLYGNDIDEEHTPFEANLDRFVHMEKDFIGRAALDRRGGKEPTRLLTGFVCEGRRAARGHFSVVIDGRKVGDVTSGSFSPCLEKGIGLCYIEKDMVKVNKEIMLTDGKAEIKAFIKKTPLYGRNLGSLCV